ncbi:hypothetical protein JOQ06_000251 [Pogonophryne albipinna]|uniref:THAP-type domain-containing protein n=1 Tax=Pogonophryne albipinna TaxID=1090488 RepID=A0AAD6AFS9_9TELE|nr:hypothetical protein JOQ06_000251 [Pogonophryne albipinna]
MPRSCCVPLCTTNKLKNPNLNFYILPNGSAEPRRRTRWLQAIRQEDEFGHLWDPKSKHVYVCSQHFITGLKNEDIAHPDYTPLLYPHKKTKSPRSVLQRLERRRKREGVQSAQPESPTSEGPAPEAPAPESPTSEAPIPLQEAITYSKYKNWTTELRLLISEVPPCRRSERVIGALKSRYHILDGPLPLRLVKRLQDERQKRQEAMIDRIVHVCAALMNLSGSVMYNRYRI